MSKERYTVFDLETPISMFSAGFKDYATKQRKNFVISEKQNDFIALMKFLRAINRYNYTLIGYNCIGFDGQILEYMFANYGYLRTLSPKKLIEVLYELSQDIINIPDEEKFSRLLPEWKLGLTYIDLLKQCHYDSPAKRTSLKWLQFTMRYPNIESMPIAHNEIFGVERVPEVLSYMDNDVDSTLEFFERVKFETDLRKQLSAEYGLNLLNASEPRMARDIFGKFLSDAMGIPYRDLKELRTYRKRVIGSEIIFPYIQFEDPLLQGVKDFFTDLHFNPYDYSDNSYDIKKVEKVFKYHTIPDMVVGLGGIHGCVPPGVYDEIPGKWVIRDLDGKSYYPNLGIKNKFYPQHLSSTFCHVLKELYDMRQKLAKDSPINYIFKIILNSAYGLSMEPNNYFHDPKYTFTTTVNGQLLLLKLGEMLRTNVPGIVFYQFNTDGVSIGYDPKYTGKVDKVMREWEKLTKIELEDVYYSKMIIVDVNNYIAVSKKDGKVKRKGLFGYSMKPEDREMYYHKNPSELIVPKALEAYFVHGKPYEEFIKESEDIYDFCSGVKVKRDFNLLEYSYDKKNAKINKRKIKQQVVRYYVTTEPLSLKKKYKPGSKMGNKAANTAGKNGKESGVVELKSGWNTKYFNVYVKKPMKDYNINYKYYLNAVRDIVKQIQPDSNQCKLNF